ncbi:MAG: hypothetical protein AAF974_09570 [Cyanobacteria bacterium P01_E01_bin.34]
MPRCVRNIDRLYVVVEDLIEPLQALRCRTGPLCQCPRARPLCLPLQGAVGIGRYHHRTLPKDPDAGVDVILELLQNRERLQAIHHRNYWNALHRHDRRRHLATVLAELDLPAPHNLQE